MAIDATGPRLRRLVRARPRDAAARPSHRRRAHRRLDVDDGGDVDGAAGDSHRRPRPRSDAGAVVPGRQAADRLLRPARRRLAGVRAVRRRGADPRAPDPSAPPHPGRLRRRRPRRPRRRSSRRCGSRTTRPAICRARRRCSSCSSTRRTCRCSARAPCRSWATTSTWRRRRRSCRARTGSGRSTRADRQHDRARVLDRQPRRAAAGRRQLAELHAGGLRLRCRATASSIRHQIAPRASPATPACATRTSTPRA